MRALALLLASSALPAQIATSTPYGVGCRGAVLDMDAPRAGMPFTVSAARNVSLPWSAALLGVGLSRASVQVEPQCSLLLLPIWVVPIPMAQMSVTLTAPRLPGLRFQVQAVLASPLGNRWTNAVEGVVGS